MGNNHLAPVRSSISFSFNKSLFLSICPAIPRMAATVRRLNSGTADVDVTPYHCFSLVSLLW